MSAEILAYGLEDNPDVILLGFANQEINTDAVLVSALLRDSARIAQAEMACASLSGKVSPHVVLGLLGVSVLPIQGRQLGMLIAASHAAPDKRGVIRS